MSQILFFVTLLIGVIPLLILFVEKKQFSTKHGIVPFVWLTALATLYEFIGTVVLKINTNYWFQLYSLLEFAAIYFYFFQLFERKHKTNLRICLIVWAVIYGISLFYWDSNSKAIALAINSSSTSLFVFLCSIAYFKSLIEAPERKFWQSTTFYFVLAFSFYYASTLFLFLSSKFVFEFGQYGYWLVNIIATLILRILLILGVWKMK
ncbi:hypothetical protein [Chryseobacterium kwangjuense]|uniref:Histidine kinase N-terminal 7TM region domain-containing protein n=1 Tax=Chryseobacterium kwangjuense TaxID=267125 RepID=A0A135WIZ3_9FLAO|nr:hypothetical protein [Chryseobacterium kwangjuense]KXH84894.1 hypothetical protein AU378_03825 [Chryseobacterium kwangjuense]